MSKGQCGHNTAAFKAWNASTKGLYANPPAMKIKENIDLISKLLINFTAEQKYCIAQLKQILTSLPLAMSPRTDEGRNGAEVDNQKEWMGRILRKRSVWELCKRYRGWVIAELEMSDSEQAARLAHPFLQYLKMLYWNKLQYAHLKGEYISCNCPDHAESIVKWDVLELKTQLAKVWFSASTRCGKSVATGTLPVTHSISQEHKSQERDGCSKQLALEVKEEGVVRNGKKMKKEQEREEQFGGCKEAEQLAETGKEQGRRREEREEKRREEKRREEREEKRREKRREEKRREEKRREEKRRERREKRREEKRRRREEKRREEKRREEKSGSRHVGKT
ncbi:hypothetical protein DUI87_09532 [Hirundo rustica rustica]|uniref:Uncharacterized protein n=1 Tax=Hirundo rustica rustica TaxID=333673 RepID=A0A3M0KMW9_HIRRU|nr:hypothetical protein DUI87_09532 [Hirundo rustica rustica]